MSKYKTLIFIIIVFINTKNIVYSQCCSGGVPISSSLGLSTNNVNSWSFLLSYDFNYIGNLYEGSVLLNDKNRVRTTSSTLFEINYGISNKLTLTSMFSFVKQDRNVINSLGKTNFTSAQGLGDGIVLIKYRLLDRKTKNYQTVAIGTGIKIPIGRSDKRDENGLSLPADLQPGSGAWDYLIWGNFERHHVLWKNFNIASVITYRITGTNNKYFGNLRYQFGNELILNLQTSYSFFITSEMFNTSIGIMYRSQTEDLVNNEVLPNSGGQFIYFNPGIGYNITPNLNFRVASNIPIYRNTIGTQLTTSYKVISSISYTLNKR